MLPYLVVLFFPHGVGGFGARWQSGYAADCKSVDAGSIPTRASFCQQSPCPSPLFCYIACGVMFFLPV